MKGFTLIELLVVVLIIGILSSVALPQYTKAVEKSRQAEAWTTLKSINDAIKIYQMEKGDDTAIPQPDDMVITISNLSGGSGSGSSSSANAKFAFAMTSSGAKATRVGGSFGEYVLMMTFEGQRYCKGENVCPQVGSKTTKKACPSITGGSDCYEF